MLTYAEVQEMLRDGAKAQQEELEELRQRCLLTYADVC
jgi:hypothetical protein